MPKKNGLFGCFGGNSDDQPEIRYEPDCGAVNLQAKEHDLPMPDITELDEKFSELVVSFFSTMFFQCISCVKTKY